MQSFLRKAFDSVWTLADSSICFPISVMIFQKTDILRAPTWNNCAKSKRFLHAVHVVAVSRELNLLADVDQLSFVQH